MCAADAVDGSPVLDLKPYVDNDTVFSPGLRISRRLTPAS
jgi:tRNA (Thr-GGU) A37 N-methylase